MKINSLIVLLISIFFLVGCYDDKGNYNYTTLNEIEIAEVNSSYYLSVGDTVIIEPKLNFAIDSNAEVSYEWNMNMQKVLSNEKNLSFIIPDTAAPMEFLLFSLEDKSTGFKTQLTTTLMVSQKYSKGWLILSEKDGKSSLDFIRRDWIEEKDGEDIYEFKEFFDVYKTAENEDLGSQPLQIQEHWRKDDRDDGHIMVVQKGGQKSVDLFGGNLRKSLSIEKEFTSVPDNFDPKEVMYAEEFSYILNSDGKVYSRRNFSSSAYYSGYFSNYPVGFEDNGVFKELNVDRFIQNVDYQWKYFVLAYEKVNKRFLAISEFDRYGDEDRSGDIMTMEYDNYPTSSYIPLHNTGDNELFYANVHSVSGWGYCGLYCIFKSAEGKYIEQQLKLKFDAYGTSSMVIDPVQNREFPEGFLDDNSVVDAPDGGGGYGSTNVYISKGNKLYYYSRAATGEIKLHEYYTFNSDIVALDDQHYQNKRMCVGLANGEVYFMDISDSAIGGQKEKLLYKVSKPLGKIKQIVYKKGDYQM